jgi:glycosyltransferase involved in cell wall biosynthesis
MTGSLPSLPRVSVCLLTYKRASALPGTIESLLDQSHADFELIINDDNSPDDTEDVCRQYARRDSRIRYIRNPQNLRYAGNQNAALLRATTDYVAIVHDGDIYRRDLVEKWTRALVEHPSAALVFNALEVMNRDGCVERVYRHPYERLVRGIDLFDDMIRRTDSPIFGIVMVRKNCVYSVGPFDPRFPVIGDVDMWLRLLLRYDAAYIPEPLLKVFPREVDHHNNSANWSIRREHELICALNTARRYTGDPIKLAEIRREIAPMLWRVRVRALLSCLRRGKLRGALEGLVFLSLRRDFTLGAGPDSVHTWADAARLASDYLANENLANGYSDAAYSHPAQGHIERTR